MELVAPHDEGVESINGLIGAVTLASGTNISLGTIGNTITINNSQSSGNYFTTSMTAQENLTVGQTVGISNLMNMGSGYVSRANRTLASTAHGVGSVSVFSNRQGLWIPIGGDNFATFFYSTAGSNTAYAQVGQINTGTLSLGLGTANSPASAISPGTANQLMTMAKLGTNSFVVFYIYTAGTTVIKYRVATVSGSTISWGTEATFYTATAAPTYISATTLGTDKGILVFNTATASSGTAIVFTNSGGTLTMGTAQGLGTNMSTANVPITVKMINTDKFVIASVLSTSSIYAVVGTCTGTTTITLGTEKQISTSTSIVNDIYLNLISPANDVFVVKWESTAALADIVACICTGTTTITNGTTLTPPSTYVGATSEIYAYSSSVLYLFKPTATGAQDLVELSGTTLTDNGVIGEPFSTITATDKLIAMDNGYPILATMDATNVNVWIAGMSYGFIGIAQASVNAGSAVNVIMEGVDTNQSGLIPGQAYIANGTGGVIITSQTSNTYFPMKALSATSILVN